MAQFFLSYKHDDREPLEHLTAHLKTIFGEDCLWFDESIPGGTDWEQVIYKEIDECQILIYLVSDEALASKYCQEELHYAITQSKQILPVLIKPLKLPYPDAELLPPQLHDYLSRRQYEDLRSYFRDPLKNIHELNRFVKSLRLLLRDPRSSEIDLSFSERWILSNQFAILAKLYPAENETYMDLKEVVDNGYELHYGWISDHIFLGSHVMSVQECVEVIDILDMFTTLKYTFEQLGDKANIDVAQLRFWGFDGNTEGKYIGYTEYLVEREERFTEVDRGDKFNSHMPMLELYRRMIGEWKQSSDRYNLTKDDIIRITSARSYRRQ